MNSKLKEALELAGINPFRIWPEDGGMIKIQFRYSDSFVAYIVRSEMELPKEKLAKLLLEKYENAEIISQLGVELANLKAELDKPSRVEVIGNIHDNPELLEDK